MSYGTNHIDYELFARALTLLHFPRSKRFAKWKTIDNDRAVWSTASIFRHADDGSYFADLPACLASFQDALPHLSHGAAVDLVGAISGVFVPPFPARVSLEPLIPPRTGSSLPNSSSASQSGKASAGAQALRRIALGGKLGGADTAISLLGGMPVSCSASPLSEPSRRAHPPPFFSPKADKKTISLIQFTFEGGGGVPGPGGGFVCEGRSVRVSLLDVFSMKFLGSVAQASLEKPKDGSRTASHSWIPTATGKAPLVSVADVLVHPQLHLYFELCQVSPKQTCHDRGDRRAQPASQHQGAVP